MEMQLFTKCILKSTFGTEILKSRKLSTDLYALGFEAQQNDCRKVVFTQSRAIVMPIDVVSLNLNGCLIKAFRRSFIGLMKNLREKTMSGTMRSVVSETAIATDVQNLKKRKLSAFPRNTATPQALRAE